MSAKGYDTATDAPAMELPATEATTDDGASDGERSSPGTRWWPPENRSNAVPAMTAGIRGSLRQRSCQGWSAGPKRHAPARDHRCRRELFGHGDRRVPPWHRSVGDV